MSQSHTIESVLVFITIARHNVIFEQFKKSKKFRNMSDEKKSQYIKPLILKDIRQEIKILQNAIKTFEEEKKDIHNWPDAEFEKAFIERISSLKYQQQDIQKHT